MSASMSSRGLQQARHATSYAQLCSSLRLIQLSNPRYFGVSATQRWNPFAIKSATDKEAEAAQKRVDSAHKSSRAKVEAALQKQRATVGKEQDPDDRTSLMTPLDDGPEEVAKKPTESLEGREIAHMDRALNPRPMARARWQAKMVMRHIRKGGRLTKEMMIARTERQHQLRSHFFKTSIKKLMPLARQIAGKTVDEAILQMRFSRKKVAKAVQTHLVQARNEAVVMKGMGQSDNNKSISATVPSGVLVLDPSQTPPQEHELPTKALRPGVKPSDTNIYIAQAWVNRGKYGKKLEHRARGRINIQRLPHTGITVLLKEQKTRIREEREKEIKAIKKRIGKNHWTQLPDRAIQRQHQHVLW